MFRSPRIKEGQLLWHKGSGLFSGKWADRYFVLRCSHRMTYTLEYGKQRSAVNDGAINLAECEAVHVIEKDHFMSIGSRVFVPGRGAGTLRYFGSHGFYRRDVAGVHLDRPVGDNDGRGMGHRYFHCPANHGVLVQPSELHLLDQTSDEARPLEIKVKKDMHLFVIVTKEGGSGAKTIRLAASSFAEMQGWIFALSKCAFGTEPVSAWGHVLVKEVDVQPSTATLSLSHPWFHGEMSRDTAEKHLIHMGLKDGMFLARQSSTEPEKLVLSVCSGECVIHVLIVTVPGMWDESSDPSEPVSDEEAVTINGRRTPVKTLKDLIAYLMAPRPGLSWTTPLTSYVACNEQGPRPVDLGPMAPAKQAPAPQQRPSPQQQAGGDQHRGSLQRVQKDPRMSHVRPQLNPGSGISSAPAPSWRRSTGADVEGTLL